jgi:protein-disulfide isomerase
MERPDLRAQLGIVRRRRAETVRVDADLARREAELEARLAELQSNPVSRREAAAASVERAYGPTRSAADLTDAIHAWRQNIRSVNSLSMDVQSDRDHVRGDLAAPVVVVEYGDYQCAECAAAHELYASVEPWVQDGRLAVVFRHFPLVDAHPLALRAAHVAEAAAAQGGFWKMHDLLMALPRDRAGHDRGELEHAARDLGLDLERLRTDIDGPAVLERILEDFRGGLASGVNGTPTFYVNGLRADVSDVGELHERIVASIGGSQPCSG